MVFVSGKECAQTDERHTNKAWRTSSTARNLTRVQSRVGYVGRTHAPLLPRAQEVCFSNMHLKSLFFVKYV